MDNNENNVQNEVNENIKKPQDSGKKLTIILGIVVLILVLAAGVCAGMIFSGKGKNNGNTAINQVEKNEKEKSNNEIDEKYLKTWETKSEGSEIQLLENGVFVKDNYTKSSEVKGEYTIDGNSIEFITDDGEKWSGKIETENEETVLNITMEGKQIKFYDLANSNTKESFFEQNKNLNYSSNPKDNINGKVAIIKMGEKIFQTEKHDGYYTYIDNFGNSYNIKEITNITSEHRMTSNDYKTNLFRAVIEYIDNNNAKKSFDTAVFVPNDANNYTTLGIYGPYENYTGSTSFVKAYTDLYDDGSNNTDYSIFNSYKGRTYKNEDFNTLANTAKEYCELAFSTEGKPIIKIGYKSDVNSECYFVTKDISNLKSEGAAGTTYVTFDFTAWTPGGDKTGSATISFSNVSEDYTMTVSAKANFDIGTREYNNIEVKAVGQNAVENFVLSEFKNRVYESQDNLTGLWYKLEFDGNGKPTITITSSDGNNKQIVDKYTRFTDVHSDGAAGTMYINFSYRLMNETGNKVQGYLGYSNNTDNDELRLKLDNLKSEIMVKRIK